MQISHFDFELPRELIAQTPASPRDKSKLLYVPVKGTLKDMTIRDLPNLMNPEDVLVINNTRVIPARLFGKIGNTGAKIQITLHHFEESSFWRAFSKPAKKLKVNDKIIFDENFCAVVIEKLQGGEIKISFNLKGESFKSYLNKIGIMPMPPYIKRNDLGEKSDWDNYQTTFASRDGAVACPTAGLHFTPNLIKNLTKYNIKIIPITLHVGAGTFLPVKTMNTESHKMHSEWGEITPESAALINAAKKKGGRVIAVGTTVLRLLETSATQDGSVLPYSGNTDIFISPGYQFKAANTLLTNFHLPKSTLFILVCAFSGLNLMKKVYSHAIKNKYRFYSYGDATLLELRK